MISQGSLEKGHAKILSGLETTKSEQLAEVISQKRLTVRQAEALLKPVKKTTKTKEKDRDTLNIEDEISGNFGHKTEIETKKSPNFAQTATSLFLFLFPIETRGVAALVAVSENVGKNFVSIYSQDDDYRKGH